MATVDKNFKVKHGLVVEGTTATVNGNDILTTANTTDNITEGSVNLYFTDERAAAAVADEISTAVGAAVGALTTDSVPEGQEPNSKLYFTAERAQDAAAAALANGTHTNITVSYDDAANAISLTGAVTYTDQDAVDAVLAEATTQNTAYKLVQRGMNGEFSAGMITADLTGDVTGTVSSLSNHDTDDVAEGTTNLYYTDERGSTAAASFIYNNFPVGPGTGINLSGYVGPTGPSEVSINRTVVDTWYDAAGAAATAESNANGYTDTAVSNLVNGAPALLDTLNELAAAINNDESFATTIATQIGEKQNSLTAGTGITLSGDTISVTANTYDAYGAATTAEQNAKGYADLNFVTLTDLPGQLDDYVPVTEKGQALGVATLDASGYVPVEQLGNVPANYVTSVGNNLSVTDGVLNLGQFVALEETDISTTGLSTGFGTMGDFREVSKIVSNRANVNVGSPYAFTFTGSAAKLIIAAKSGADVHVSEVLIAIDASAENAYVTEYASIATSTDLFSVDSVTVGNPNEVIISTLSGQISVSVTLQTIRF